METQKIVNLSNLSKFAPKNGILLIVNQIVIVQKMKK